jgi:uncharacterized protein YodC (DUF2158 family)
VANDTEELFEIGDVVCLKGPSSAMTVIALGDSAGKFLCAWFTADRVLQQHMFDEEALQKWENRR